MIDFLDQLEGDLVEAIDRRERSTGPRRRRVRLELVAAGAAIAVALVLVFALGSQRTRERAVTHPTTPAVTNPAPIPKGTPLRIRGAVRRVGAQRWQGSVPGPGGAGVLTLVGPVDLTARPCCEGFHRYNTHVLRFRWTSARGSISGCVVNTTYRRPHARFVWDGPGRVTATSGAFARYRGREISIGGASDIGLPTRALIVLGADGRPPGGC